MQFSKRKAGLMKKAYELSTLTGTQILVLVTSETGHVYTFATKKFQPFITDPKGKNLIQQCLSASEIEGNEQPDQDDDQDDNSNRSADSNSTPHDNQDVKQENNTTPQSHMPPQATMRQGEQQQHQSLPPHNGFPQDYQRFNAMPPMMPRPGMHAPFMNPQFHQGPPGQQGDQHGGDSSRSPSMMPSHNFHNPALFGGHAPLSHMHSGGAPQDGRSHQNMPPHFFNPQMHQNMNQQQHQHQQQQQQQQQQQRGDTRGGHMPHQSSHGNYFPSNSQNDEPQAKY